MKTDYLRRSAETVASKVNTFLIERIEKNGMKHHNTYLCFNYTSQVCKCMSSPKIKMAHLFPLY